jgi:hypothetical protein
MRIGIVQEKLKCRPWFRQKTPINGFLSTPVAVTAFAVFLANKNNAMTY